MSCILCQRFILAVRPTGFGWKIRMLCLKRNAV